MQLNDKFMMALIYAHGGEIIDRIESEAEHNSRLRWLARRAFISDPTRPVRDRIEPIAGIQSLPARRTRPQDTADPLDCEAMSVAELGAPGSNNIPIRARPRRQFLRDDGLRGRPAGGRSRKAIDLIVEILKIETNPALLSLLAAGPLEDVISMETIDRIEREAHADKRFHHLLGGVWYYRASDELKARLMRWSEATAGEKLLEACRRSAQTYRNSGLIRHHPCDASRLKSHAVTPSFSEVHGWIGRAGRLHHRLRVQCPGPAASRRALSRFAAEMARRIAAQDRRDRRPSRLRSLDVARSHPGDCRTHQRAQA